MRTMWRLINTDLFPPWTMIPAFMAGMYVLTWVGMYIQNGGM